MPASQHRVPAMRVSFPTGPPSHTRGTELTSSVRCLPEFSRQYGLSVGLYRASTEREINHERYPFELKSVRPRPTRCHPWTYGWSSQRSWWPPRPRTDGFLTDVERVSLIYEAVDKPDPTKATSTFQSKVGRCPTTTFVYRLRDS